MLTAGMEYRKPVVTGNTAAGIAFCAIAVVVGSCSFPANPVTLADFQSNDPVRQIKAMKWAADNSVKEAIPYLIEYLDHEDPARRLYAITALRKITGKDLGYDVKADAKRRAQAVQRWRRMYTHHD